MKKLAEQYTEREFYGSELEERLHKEYAQARKKNERKHFYQDHKQTIIILSIIGIFILGMLGANFNDITGMISYDKQNEKIVFINEIFNETSNILLNETFVGLAISGEYGGSGSGIIELIDEENNSYIIYIIKETKRKNLVTGLVIENNETNNTINISKEIIKNETVNKIITLLNETNNETKINETNTIINETSNTNNTTINNTNRTIILINQTNTTINQTINETTNQTTPINEIENDKTNSQTKEILIVNETNKTIIKEINHVIIQIVKKIQFKTACVETCTLPKNKIFTHIKITIEGNLSVTINTIHLAIEETIEQIKEIPNQEVIFNEINYINLEQYFSSSKEIIFDIPTTKGFNLTIINKTQLAITPFTFQSANIFIYVTNGNELIKSNTFKLKVVENISINNTLNETLNLTFNITKKITTNVSINHTNFTGPIQGEVIIGQPVTWTSIEEAREKTEIIVPYYAKNIRVKAVHEGKERIIKNKEISLKSKKISLTIEENSLIFDSLAKANKKENITLILNETNVTSYVIEFETPGPEQIEEEVSQSKKIVSINSEIHYENVPTNVVLPTPAPIKGIRLKWVTEGVVVSQDEITYIDSNKDGLIESISWIIPHLSNQTFEINIIVLNPLAYLKDGDIWTVEFETIGNANLTINSTNANFTEKPEDNTSTIDEMEFLNFTCDGKELFDELKINSVDYDLFSGKPKSFSISNYSCEGIGEFTTKVHKAGYAQLQLTFANQEQTITDYATDPNIDSCQTLNVSGSTYTLNQSVTSTGTCFTVENSSITIDCQGYTINYASSALGYAVYINGDSRYDYDNLTIKNCIINQSGTNDTSNALELRYLLDSTISNNTIKTYTQYSQPINLYYSNGLIIANNTIVADIPSWGLDGAIYLSYSDDVQILNNSVSANGFDNDPTIAIYHSENATLENNNITSNYSQGISIEGNTILENQHSIDNTNYNDRYPIYYNDSLSNMIVLENLNLTNTYGQIICSNCNNVTYKNLTLNNDGISFFHTDNSTVNNVNNTISTGYSIYLFYSDNNLFSNSNITSTSNNYALHVDHSDNNNFTNLTISTNNYRIMTIPYSNNNIFRNINLTGEYIDTRGSESNYINFNFESNGDCFYLGLAAKNIFQDSNLSCSGNHFNVYSTSEQTILRNTTLNKNLSINWGATGHTINIEEYVDVNITNTTNSMISGVTVITKDNLGVIRNTEITDGTTILHLNALIKTFISTSNTSKNNNTINATLNGYIPNWTIINITNSNNYTNSNTIHLTLSIDDVPYISLVTISPASVNSTNDLIGHCTGGDGNGDNVTYYYQWYVNSSLNETGVTNNNFTSDLEVNIANISNSITSNNDNWILSCLASDGTYNSTWTNSSIKIIYSADTGLIGHWTLDEGNGTIGAIIADSTSNKNNGTLTEATMNVIDGIVGQYALYSNATAGYVLIPYNSSLDAQNMTISAWLYNNDTTTTTYAYIRRVGEWHTRHGGGYWDFDGESVWDPGAITPTDYDFRNYQNTWRHHIIVIDMDSLELRFYIDGEQIGANHSFTTAHTAGTGDLYLGRYSSGYRWQGGIDEFRIYNYSMSGSEINALYQKYIAHQPKVTTFDGTTNNFTQISDYAIKYYSGLIIENTTYGKIEWNNDVDATAADFDSYISITNSTIIVTSESLDTSINSSANITFYDTGITNQVLLKDGAQCTDCNLISNTGTSYSYSVNEFSNYTLTTGSLTIDYAMITWTNPTLNAEWSKIMKGHAFPQGNLSNISVGSYQISRIGVALKSNNEGNAILYGATDTATYTYNYNGLTFENETNIGTTTTSAGSTFIDRYNNQVIAVWGTGNSADPPYYRISTDGGITWEGTETAIPGAETKYSSGGLLTFKYLTDGTGIAVWKRTTDPYYFVYAIWNGTGWNKTGILDTVAVGWYDTAGIGVLPDGEAFVMFGISVGTSDTVYVKKWNGTNFSSSTTIDGSSNYFFSNQAPAISCNTNGKCITTWANPVLEYSRWNGTNWSAANIQVDGIATWGVTYTSLTPSVQIDDNNNAILVWYSNDRTKVEYATYNWTEDTWTYKESLGTPHPSINVGSAPQIILIPTPIENIPPINSQTKITPTQPLTNETIIGYCNATDLDEDTIGYYYNWYKEGIIYSNGFTGVNYAQEIEINVQNISFTNTSKGEEWTLECIANDGEFNDSTPNNNSIQITNPEISILKLPSYPNATEDIICNITLIDKINNSLIAHYKWYKNDVFNLSGQLTLNSENYNTTTLLSGNTSNGEKWTCEVTPSDGIFNGTTKNTSTLIRDVLSINKAIITWSDNNQHPLWARKYDNQIINRGTITTEYHLHTLVSEQSKIVELGFNHDETGNIIFRSVDDENIHTYNFNGSSWNKTGNILGTGYITGPYQIKRFGNNVMAVWRSITTEAPYYKLSKDAGKTWEGTSKEIENNTYVLSTNNIKLSYLTDGTALMIYKKIPSPYLVYSLWDGNLWNKSGLVDETFTSSVSISSIAPLPNGKAFVIYSNTSDTNDIIYVSQWNGTNFETRTTIDSQNNNEASIFPVIDCNIQGKCVATWTTSGANLYIEYATYNGTNWSVANVRIDGVATWSQVEYDSEMDLKMDDEGNAILIWYNNNASEIKYATYNWNNNNWTEGTEVIGSRGTITNNAGPKISLVPGIILNVPPVNIAPRITPLNPLTNDTLKGYCKADDINGDNLTLEWKWYKNTILNTSGLSNNHLTGIEYNIANISSSNTTKGDDWTFSCQANDGIEEGAFWVNTSVSVQNTKFIKHTIYPYVPTTTQDLNCNFTILDDYSSPLTTYYNWYKNDVLNLSGSMTVTSRVEYSLTLLSGNTTIGDKWTCEIITNDGNKNMSSNNSIVLRYKKSINNALITWIDEAGNLSWAKKTNHKVSDLGPLMTDYTPFSGLTNSFPLTGINKDDMHVIFVTSTNHIIVYDYNGTNWTSNDDLRTASVGTGSVMIDRYKNNVMAIWGDTSNDAPYYRLSTDGGITWDGTSKEIPLNTYKKVLSYNNIDFKYLTDGTGILVYKDDATNGYIYTLWNGTNWTTSQILYDDNYPYGHANIGLLPDGEAMITFIDDPYDDVYAIKWDGTSFNTAILIDMTNSGTQYSGAIIDCNIQGNCIAAWNDGLDDNIEFSRYNGSSWSDANIDIHSVYAKTSPYTSLDIKIDDENNAIIVWYKSSETVANYATYNWEDNEWTMGLTELTTSSTYVNSYGKPQLLLPPTKTKTVNSIITPTEALVNETIIGYCNATDLYAEDTVNYYWKWYDENNNLHSNGSNKNNNMGTAINIANISSSLTNQDEMWTLSCRVDDGTTTNSTWNNKTIVIHSYTPIIQNASIRPLIPFNTEELIGNCTARDNDTNKIFYEYKWYKNNVLYKSNKTNMWIENNSMKTGLISYSNLKPEAFYLDSKLQLLIGDATTLFEAYTWNGTQWIDNATLETGAPSDSFISPAVYSLNGQTHLLIGKFSTLTIRGYTWTGSTWTLNTSVSSGLPYYSGAYTTIETAKIEGEIYAFIMNSNGELYTYKRVEQGWIKDADIQQGLTTESSYSSITIIDFFNKKYLIMETNNNLIGYRYENNVWIIDSFPILGINTTKDRNQGTSYQYNNQTYLLYPSESTHQAYNINSYDQNISVNIINISSSELNKGENWTFSCRAYGNHLASDWINSSEVTINAISNLTIILNNTFVNFTTSHGFNVTAGVNSTQIIMNTTINYSSGSCVYLSNSTIGDLFNVTYTCTGSPFVINNLNITFCDTLNTCVTTNLTGNSYPNQAPSNVTLLTPTNGNQTVHDLRPFFNWTNATDIEGDAIHHTFNITTTVNCEPLLPLNVTTSNYTPTQDLCPDALKIYNWTVQACDTWSCSAISSTWNFTLEPYIDLLIVNNAINFGSLNIGNHQNTTSGTPAPFHIQNKGNVYCDLVNISAQSSLFSTVTLDNNNFQMKARMPPGNNSFNETGSLMSWVNVTSTNTSLIDNLNHSTNNNNAYVDIGITVPLVEPSGEKQTIMTFTWEQTPGYTS